MRQLIHAPADDRGQDMIEYALVVGVVAIGLVLLFLFTPIGPAFNTLVAHISACVDADAATVC